MSASLLVNKFSLLDILLLELMEICVLHVQFVDHLVYFGHIDNLL